MPQDSLARAGSMLVQMYGRSHLPTFLPLAYYYGHCFSPLVHHRAISTSRGRAALLPLLTPSSAG